MYIDFGTSGGDDLIYVNDDYYWKNKTKKIDLKNRIWILFGRLVRGRGKTKEKTYYIRPILNLLK